MDGSGVYPNQETAKSTSSGVNPAILQTKFKGFDAILQLPRAGFRRLLQILLSCAFFFFNGLILLKATPDTLINFNTLLGGVQRITMPSDQALPAGFSLQPEGVFLGSDSLMLQSGLPLNFKAETGNGDVYEIQVQVRRKGAIRYLLIQTDRIEMAAGWRREGKILVVVAVSVIVFAAIVAFLLYLERRISRLEKGTSS